MTFISNYCKCFLLFTSLNENENENRRNFSENKELQSKILANLLKSLFDVHIKHVFILSRFGKMCGNIMRNHLIVWFGENSIGVPHSNPFTHGCSTER